MAMLRQAGAFGQQQNHKGTVGEGSMKAEQRRREVVSIKSGRKTQGQCSGHELCNNRKCAHRK